MGKFRKWFFKFLTGYDLIEYKDLLDLASQICELNKEINEESKANIALAKEVNEKYWKLLEQHKEVNINEALG